MPTSRGISDAAALVTTRFAPVTRAPSVQASRVPGSGLSQGLRFNLAAIRAHKPAHWGPQAPRTAAPPLAREFEARFAVAGKACGLSGQLVM